MNIKTQLANKGNYGSARSTDDIKYIVIHYTGNDGDTDENNGKYFAREVLKVSAHYFVDDDSVTQSVPDNYIAWHCGTKKTYKHKECRNANSIGIEICDDVKNGTIYPSAKTIQNALELTEMLMKKYNIPKENVIRHYDVTGKLCPAYWCGTTAKNNKWKTEFWNKLNSGAAVKPNPQTGGTVKKMYRVQVGVFSFKNNAVVLANKLKAAGYDTIIKYEAATKYYRVQVGAFSNKANAEKLVKELKSKGYSAIIKEE